MLERILTQLLYLLIIFPVCYFLFKDKSKETWKVFLTFCVYFITIQIVLYFPLRYPSLDFLGGNFNWTGKVFSIIVSLLFLIFYKKFSLKDYNLTFSQKKNTYLISILILIFLFCFAGYLEYGSNGQKLNLEGISYQLTMPGFEEELAYRGIMLGLLSQIFLSELKIGKYLKINSAILVTSLLFGLMHSLFIKNNFSISINWYAFKLTFFLGLVFAYLAHKTKSILFPVIGHNLYNTTLQIFKMFIN